MDDRTFRRGDVDGDGYGDLSDVVGLLGFLFSGGGSPPCEKSADIDDSGLLDVSDAVYGLMFLLVGGPAPGEPFRACGLDRTGDALTCASFDLCR
jgi:hypothetical protein